MDYKLGDTVKVLQVVKKGKQPGGLSVPVIEDVTPFDGVIVGKRWACEGGNGHAPVQKFECWEVATDLNTSFKVPLDGVEPVAAPIVQPAQQVGTNVATTPATLKIVGVAAPNTLPPITVQPYGPTPVSRAALAPNEYDTLVANTLTEFVQAKRSGFTAHDMTVALRTKYPNLDIDHFEIRGRVHMLAQALLGTVLEETPHASGAIAYNVL